MRRRPDSQQEAARCAHGALYEGGIPVLWRPQATFAKCCFYFAILFCKFAICRLSRLQWQSWFPAHRAHTVQPLAPGSGIRRFAFRMRLGIFVINHTEATVIDTHLRFGKA